MKAVCRRYLLFQVPGWTLAALLAVGLWKSDLIGGWTAACAVAVWLLKDILLYPMVRHAYERDGRGGADRFVGETGTCVTEVSSSGQLRTRGELWGACGQSDMQLGVGQNALVIAVQGMTLLVRPLDRFDGTDSGSRDQGAGTRLCGGFQQPR